MPLIPYDAFQNLAQWKRELNHLFPFTAGFTEPRIDIFETEKEVVAACEIPGLEKKEDISIDVDNNVLTISGMVNRTNEMNENQMYRKERFVGRFQRAVALPVAVKAEETKASYRNGILEVKMPKVESDTRRRIDIDFQ